MHEPPARIEDDPYTEGDHSLRRRVVKLFHQLDEAGPYDSLAIAREAGLDIDQLKRAHHAAVGDMDAIHRLVHVLEKLIHSHPTSD